MKVLRNVLLIALCSVIVYLYLNNKKTTASLQNQIRSLEKKISTMDDACETKLALLKADLSAQHMNSKINILSPALARTEKSLIDPAASHARIITEMVAELRLNLKQGSRLNKIMYNFEKAKQKAFSKALADKIFFIDPRYIAMINTLRAETLTEVKAILTEEQYNLMFEKEYDRKLGLKTLLPPVPAKS